MADLREKVFDNLNSAIEGGYTEILGWTAEDVALDLLAYAEDCQEDTLADVLSHVQVWLEERKHG